MNTNRRWEIRVAGAMAASMMLTLSAGTVAAASPAGNATRHAPVVITRSGAVRGDRLSRGFAFRGLSYAAPPTAHLPWRSPQPAVVGSASRARQSRGVPRGSGEADR